MRRQLVLTLLVLLVCSAAAFTAHAPTQAAGQEDQQQAVIRFVKNPDAAPAFALPGLDGKPVTLDEAKGKIVLLNFWATWCGPCRAEIPDLIRLQESYKDKLEIIGLAVDDDDPSLVEKFAKKAGINYRVAMASEEVRAKYGGIPALPTSFVLDNEGRVVQKHVGLNNPALYEIEIRALLGMPIPFKVETFEDTGQVFLAHADRASELPGVDMSKLTPEQRSVALRRFNAESCTCGCGMTLAQCRINDSGCGVSKAITARIVADIAKGGSQSGKTEGAAPQRK